MENELKQLSAWRCEALKFEIKNWAMERRLFISTLFLPIFFIFLMTGKIG
jgi:hypothetical protein